MTSTNGQGPKRAILYARVSTDEQARSGYSLAQQIEALREYAAREGYEVLEEVEDPGQSGASLARPGLDCVRDLVAAGGVSVVLAQDRDRFAREPAYLYLLKKEFEEHGTKLRSLNDRGDDSPEGQFTEDVLDVMAKFERAKTAERTRRGKIRKVREGKLLRSPQPPFGFRYNVGGDGLVIHEPEMHVVEKIFCMAAEGLGTRAMQSRLHSAGTPTAKGEPVWSYTSLKRIVTSDVYMPHTYDEMVKLVGPAVAEKLDPNKQYGIRWHNRHKAKERTVSEPDGNGGRRYRKRVSRTLRPQDEWVAVPVPAYLPRSLIERARAAMANNKGVDRKHLAREWELRGLMRCSCGAAMETHTVQPHTRLYHYYSCRRRRRLRKMCDCEQPSIQAHKVEPVVWKFVSGLLKDPEHIKHGMERMIAREREGAKGDPQREERAWAEKLVEMNHKRSRYQEMAAEGLITFDELRAKLAELEDTCGAIQRELEGLRNRRERVEELERDRDALLEYTTAMVPETLDDLSGTERNKLYRMLQLEVTLLSEGGYRVEGAFCTSELPSGSSDYGTWAPR